MSLVENMLAAPKGVQEHDEHHEHLLRAVKRAAAGELTKRQMECVELFYGKGIKEKEIAEILGVRPPTVCRHLAKARRRLRRVLEYYI
jgi:RNA polymerase sigma factor (sigma-70 family)